MLASQCAAATRTTDMQMTYGAGQAI